MIDRISVNCNHTKLLANAMYCRLNEHHSVPRVNKNPINALSKGGLIRLFSSRFFFLYFIFNFVYSDEIRRTKTEVYLKHSLRPYSLSNEIQ